MKWKAIIIGIISFAVLWIIWAFLSPSYDHQSIHTYSLIVNIFYSLIPLISGFICAQFAKQNGLRHGLILGLILAALSLAGWLALGLDPMSMLQKLGEIVLLTPLGGGLNQGIQLLMAKRRAIDN